MEAAASGLAVLRGGCWEGGGAPAYWPFIQLIRAAFGGSRQRDLPKLPNLRRTSYLTREFAQLVQELQPPPAADHAGVPVQSSGDPEQARFRLFDSVARVLRQLADFTPLLMIIEDLHDADQASLLMLRLVVRELKDAPVMVIGTYRDIGVQRSPAVSQLIGELTREGTQLPLFALKREDAAMMIQARNGAPASPKLVSEIYQASGGNPLFIDGLVRVLTAEDRLNEATRLSLAAFRVPDGVQETIRQWLALLSDRRALMAAATIGQDFETWCLQRVTQLAKDQLLGLLREATAAGILVRASGDAYRFSHSLIRNALYEEINWGDRTSLHLKIAQCLEEYYQADIQSHAAQLAQHFQEGGDLSKAVEYFIRAGEAARAVFAYEETARHWRTALELTPDTREQYERRANLLERLSELLALNAAEGSEQINLLEQALRLYQALGQAQAMARVHSRLAVWKAVRSDADISLALDHTEKARALLSQNSGPSSTILSCLGSGAAATVRMSFDEALTAFRQAMDLSKEAEDEIHWAHAGIMQASVLFYLGRPAVSFDLIDKMCGKIDQLDDNLGAWLAAITACRQFFVLLDPVRALAWANRELGNPRIAQASMTEKSLLEHLGLGQTLMGDLASAEGLVTQLLARPLYGGYSLKEHLAFYAGDWPGAELLLAQSMNEQIRAHAPLQFCLRSPLAARLLRLQGRPVEAEAILEKTLTIVPTGPGVLIEMVARQELALDCVDAGRLAQAQLHLARCREILGAGEDWRGLVGCVARGEGALAAAEARFQDANDRFAHSIRIFRRYQVPFEAAETLRHWGRALLAAGNHRAALEKLDAAADLYRRHGAGERWLETLQADRLHAAGSPALPAKSTRELPQSGADRKPGEDSSPTGVFRKQGEYWTFSWTGSESRLKERRGFHYIAWMLRHPGREFAASDLVSLMEAASLPLSDVGGPATGPEIVTVNHGLGDAGPRLDFRAKTQYKRRLEDLREELELAERLNDPGRAERARGEIEFIQDEIGAATGLGGRSRKNSSHAERARLAVTKTVKAALERIRQADPELGRHLTLSIRTGNFCAYLPEQPVPWLL